MIDGGAYLWNCMKYIDLNMVRVGVVGHPAEEYNNTQNALEAYAKRLPLRAKR